MKIFIHVTCASWQSTLHCDESWHIQEAAQSKRRPGYQPMRYILFVSPVSSGNIVLGTCMKEKYTLVSPAQQSQLTCDHRNNNDFAFGVPYALTLLDPRTVLSLLVSWWICLRYLNCNFCIRRQSSSKLSIKEWKRLQKVFLQVWLRARNIRRRQHKSAFWRETNIQIEKLITRSK